jgi:ribbon-helix-helix CopG family protein
MVLEGPSPARFQCRVQDRHLLYTFRMAMWYRLDDMKQDPPPIRFSLSAPSALLALYDQIARDEGLARADIIRRALREYVRPYEAVQQISQMLAKESQK